MKESMAGHICVNGVYHKFGNRNTKGRIVGPRWDLEMLLL
jgi:hypothetical protein